MTGFTRTNIYNMALRLIGTERVNDYNESSPSAALMNDVWDVAKLTALSTHEWRFAATVAQLQRSSTTPDAGYDYKYQTPSDMVRINSVWSDADMLTIIEDWELRGGFLHCSSDYVYVEYVQSDTSVGSWPAWFVTYMAAVLAFYAASTQKSTSETDRFEKLMDKRLGEARSIDSTQQPKRRPPPGRWIRAVRGNYRTI